MPDIEKKKVEFIESYIKIGNDDYQWNDNHGELIRCKDCVHWIPGTITDKDDFIWPRCERNGGGWSSDDYCSCAERREMNEQYTGTASLPDGTEVNTSGTIAECANWADNIIREFGGDIRIEIIQKGAES